MLAFVGGTGRQGLGLALRFAAAGEEVIIGSRAPARAAALAEHIRHRVPAARARGLDNLAAIASADRVVLTLPFAGLEGFLDAAHARLAGKLVVDVVVPVTYRQHFFELAKLPGAASAGELIQRRAPAARVVSAFKNISADRLADLAAPLEGDVLLCGEEPAARGEVAALVRLLPGLRPVDAGRLANSRYLEAITALLLNLNARYRARTSIAILSL
jgi:hypothetical protein